MSATLLNCFGEKEINPICKSFMDCILYNTILCYVNLINISLQLTFFFKYCTQEIRYYCMSFKALLILNISKVYMPSVSLWVVVCCFSFLPST